MTLCVCACGADGVDIGKRQAEGEKSEEERGKEKESGGPDVSHTEGRNPRKKLPIPLHRTITKE